mmetsp:Transcript_1708/g.3644  ORF Transcript_1708/g.3644 Transcript_1708/m.3644 type:complete len:893 (+) Transcript_1708:276-2954(+)
MATPSLRLSPVSHLRSRSKRLEKKPSTHHLMHYFDRDYQKLKWKVKTIDLLKESHRLIRAPCLPEMLTEVSIKNETFKEFMSQKRPSYLFESRSPHAQFSKQCIDGNLPPLPVLAHIKGNSLVLNRYSLSEVVTKGLSQAIPMISQLKVLHLDENGLNDASGAMLVQAIANQGLIESFYYTRNQIGQRFIEELENYASSGTCSIRELSFRGCRCQGGIVKRFIKCLHQFQLLSKLNLAELSLPDDVAGLLSKYLRRSNLLSLDISWNSLSGTSAMTILSGMMHNRNLMYLDLSWNKLTDPNFIVANAIMKVLRTHTSLLHINLTFSQFIDTEIVMVLQGLLKSSSVVALHLSAGLDCGSNSHYIKLIDAAVAPDTKSESASSAACPFIGNLEKITKDPDGKQQINLRQRDNMGVLHLKHRDDLVNIHSSIHFRKPKMGSENSNLLFSRILGHPRIKNSDQWHFTQHCWVCEGWSFIQLEVNEEDLIEVTSTDRFQQRSGQTGEMVLKSSMNGWNELAMDMAERSWSIELLCPPGNHLVWFLKGSSVFISRQMQWKKKWGVRCNVINVPVRSEELKIVLAKKEIKTREFEKSKSVFKSFIEDSPKLLATMYAKDMQWSKIPRVIKKPDELAEVAELLQLHYKEIKDIFEFTAASSNYPSIGWLDFSDFCVQCQMLDKKHLNTAAIDRIFIAVNVELIEMEDNPDRDLCRYEFFEILVRMALCKYQDLPIRPVEMVKRLLEEHIFKYATPSQASNFRRERIFTLPVNDLLEANQSHLSTLFNKYKERSGRFLVIDSVKTILEKSGLSINERELVKAFAFAKMTVVDEQNSGGIHTKMQFVEFNEFFCRLSDLLFPQEAPLEDKLVKTMDAIFPPHNLHRKPVNDYGSEPSDIEV